MTVTARDDRRWTLEQRHTATGRHLEAYGPWVYGEDPIEVVPAEQLRGAVATASDAISLAEHLIPYVSSKSEEVRFRAEIADLRRNLSARGQ